MTRFEAMTVRGLASGDKLLPGHYTVREGAHVERRPSVAPCPLLRRSDDGAGHWRRDAGDRVRCYVRRRDGSYVVKDGAVATEQRHGRVRLERVA